jgi:hypothetical protein
MTRMSEAGDPALIADLIRSRADALLDATVLEGTAARQRIALAHLADLAQRLGSV